MARDERRVVVTGMGVVTPYGHSLDALWRNIAAGRSCIDRITTFEVDDLPVQIGAEIRDFDPLDYMDRKSARRMGRFSHFAVAAARMALADACYEVPEAEAERVGVVIGSSGSLFDPDARVEVRGGDAKLNPFYLPITAHHMAACHVSLTFGTLSSYAACGTGSQVLGDALHLIRRGDADVVLAGSSDNTLSRAALVHMGHLGGLSKRNHEPQKASRPFDAERDGFVIGDGAAVWVMESLERAVRRGARIYAEVLGAGNAIDGHNLAAPDPTGAGMARAMRAALRDARVSPDEIDYVNPHGSSTPLNDAAETRAMKLVFGERAYRVPVSSTKSMHGHLAAAAGSIEATICVLAMLHQTLPPTINYETPDPECDLDYVPNVARLARIDTCMSNSFGIGGQNAVLVLRRYQG